MNPAPLVFDALTEELTVRDYARSQGVTIQTAYRRIWDGRVPARQIYGRWLITQDRSVELMPKPTVTKSQAPDYAPANPRMPPMSRNQEQENKNNAEKASGH